MKLRFFMAGLAFAVVFGCMGMDDYAEAKKTERRYCENVKVKLWPDYQKNFKDICKKDIDSKAS